MNKMLNTEKVEYLRKEKGPTISWLIEYLGLGRTSGYLMFRKGVLIEEPAKRAEMLHKLAKFLGVKVSDIIKEI